MTQEEMALLQEMIKSTLNNADNFNKIWIAAAAVIVSGVTAILGIASQITIGKRQIESQKIIAKQQASAQLQSTEDQVAMQELASRRIAAANISDKRQDWINELRSEISKYLSLWQEISWRWEAMIDRPSTARVSDEQLEAFSKPIAEMRLQAHEVEIRIILRLNPNEEKHNNLKQLMQKLEKTTQLYHRDTSDIPAKEIQRLFISTLDEVTKKTQEILKEEWDRLKKEAYTVPTPQISASKNQKIMPFQD